MYNYRGKTIRVFLSGDYEFLCNMFGLSGASGKKTITGNSHNYYHMKILIGRHCCLWCLIKSEELKNPPANVPSRSTGSILSDHRSFIADGGNLKRAKNFNNCVREPFFKIPLNQVRIDTINISHYSPKNVGLPSRPAHQLRNLLSTLPSHGR